MECIRHLQDFLSTERQSCLPAGVQHPLAVEAGSQPYSQTPCAHHALQRSGVGKLLSQILRRLINDRVLSNRLFSVLEVVGSAISRDC